MRRTVSRMVASLANWPMPMLVVPETISITRNALKAVFLIDFISSSLLRSAVGLSTGVPNGKKRPLFVLSQDLAGLLEGYRTLWDIGCIGWCKSCLIRGTEPACATSGKIQVTYPRRLRGDDLLEDQLADFTSGRQCNYFITGV